MAYISDSPFAAIPMVDPSRCLPYEYHFQLGFVAVGYVVARWRRCSFTFSVLRPY